MQEAASAAPVCVCRHPVALHDAVAAAATAAAVPGLVAAFAAAGHAAVAAAHAAVAVAGLVVPAAVYAAVHAAAVAAVHAVAAAVVAALAAPAPVLVAAAPSQVGQEAAAGAGLVSLNGGPVPQTRGLLLHVTQARRTASMLVWRPQYLGCLLGYDAVVHWHTGPS